MFAGENLIRALHERKVRFVGIGVWGANHYAAGITELFSTQDEDLFLPPERHRHRSP